jgi:hypothetical protein
MDPRWFSRKPFDFKHLASPGRRAGNGPRKRICRETKDTMIRTGTEEDFEGIFNIINDAAKEILDDFRSASRDVCGLVDERYKGSALIQA